jgi:Site-specific recombinase XerD
MINWVSAGRGIRYREHPTRKHGQRPDRYWCIRYTLDGRDIDEALGWWSEGVSKAHCSQALAELRQNHRTGQGSHTLKELRQVEGERLAAEAAAREAGQPGDLTLAGFREDYFDRLRSTVVPRTVKSSIGHLDTWLKPLENMPLGAITSVDLERLVVQPMLEKGLSPGSIERNLSTFSAMWTDAKRLGLISGPSPLKKTARPKQDNSRDRFLSYDEARRLLEALKDKSILVHDLALMALFTGMRFGECRNLVWADIDFDNGLIFVRKSKNGRSRHTHVTAEVEEMLRRRLAEQSPGDRVFNTPAGGESYSFQSHHFKMTVRALKFNEGITDRRQMVVFHTLRHTFASWLVMMGKPLYTVSKLMGHRGIRHTQRYAHLAPSAQREAARQLEGFLK